LKKKLQLDFYLTDYNVAIECQGRQHFEIINEFGGEKIFMETQERDEIKKQVCEKHGVKLFYVNYNDNVKEKLDEILSYIKTKFPQ
jgi:very-short-patch-repair endonuclease